MYQSTQTTSFLFLFKVTFSLFFIKEKSQLSKTEFKKAFSTTELGKGKRCSNNDNIQTDISCWSMLILIPTTVCIQFLDTCLQILHQNKISKSTTLFCCDYDFILCESHNCKTFYAYVHLFLFATFSTKQRST